MGGRTSAARTRARTRAMSRAEAYSKSKAHLVAYFITLSIAIVLMVVSFVIPPEGVIDSSALKAAALLLAFYCAFDLPHLVISLKTFKLSKGDLTFEGETKAKHNDADGEGKDN